jgi:DNA processing protein
MTGEEGRGGSALAWAALNQIEGIGAGAMLRLARVFGSPEAALGASSQDLVARGHLSLRQAEELKQVAASLDRLRRKTAAWEAQGLALLAMGEESYPSPLLDLRSPPPLLYLRGALMASDSRAVAVVGTREPTPEGTLAAEKLARGMAGRGFTIVSGLARGIDTAGHWGALAVEKGRTIAVLGCGLLRIYPPENGDLAERIVESGCLMAEVPPETEASRRLLLARDRIQAALSLAVIVVQAHAECGSIVTARQARRCQRLLFGVPWEGPPFSEGWQRLRRLGARPIYPDADLDEVAQRIAAHHPSSPQRGLL